jgi:hypothetical protein
MFLRRDIVGIGASTLSGHGNVCGGVSIS